MFKSVVESYTCIYILYIYMSMFYIFVFTSYIYQYIKRFSLVFCCDSLRSFSASWTTWADSAAISIPKVWTNVTSKSWNFAKFGVSSLQTVFYLIIFRSHLRNSLGCIWIRNTKSSPHLNVCFFKQLRDWPHHQKLPYVQSLPINGGQRTNSNGHPPFYKRSFQEHLQNGQNVPALLIPKILPLCLKAFQILVYLPCLLRKIAVVSFVLPNKKLMKNKWTVTVPLTPPLGSSPHKPLANWCCWPSFRASTVVVPQPR